MPDFAPKNNQDASQIIASFCFKARQARLENKNHPCLHFVGRTSRLYAHYYQQSNLNNSVNQERQTSCISSRNLKKIVEYNPNNNFIQVQSGVDLSDIDKLLAENNQSLAFEPRNISALYGDRKINTSIAGCYACNSSGSRRLSEGGCCDSVLGVSFVNGRGQLIKAGGRVVKNVTGYDIVKFGCGAYGLTGFVTEIGLKVITKYQTSRSVLVAFNSIAEAQNSLLVINKLFIGVTAIAFFVENSLNKTLYNTEQTLAPLLASLPQQNEKNSDENKSCVMLIRIEGLENFIVKRLNTLKKSLAETKEHKSNTRQIEVINHKISSQMWQAINNIDAFNSRNSKDKLNLPPVWQIVIRSHDLPYLAVQLENLFCHHKITFAFYADVAGQVVFLSYQYVKDVALAIQICKQVRSLVSKINAKAMILRLPKNQITQIISQISVRSPVDDKVGILQNKLKLSFDPLHLWGAKL